MTALEIRAAINFGKDIIEEYKEKGETAPSWVYERMMQLYEELTEKLAKR